MAEKGHQFAEVKSRVESLPGGPKLVKVTFDINEGPKVKVRDIEFVGNEKVSDGTLKRKMKETKEHWFLSWITGRGTYQETKFEEDAEKVEGFYREQGYIQARLGTPEIKTLEDSKDGETRWVQLRVPVTEGHRYRVGSVTFEGNKVIDTKFLQPLFKLETGEFYSEKDVRKGFEKAREVYGGGGYFEFTGFPDMQFEDPAEGPVEGPAQPTVNITMRMTEGEQYFVNRITFTGNTTTRDNVIRREMRLVEGGVFSTEALKYSVRRLNQLGYFQNLEQSPNAVDVQKTTNSPERGGRHPQARGTEPQSADVWRRRLAVRRLLRPAVVPDLQLPRPRRVVDALDAGRLARRELPGRVHRAVPVRSQHHRRRGRLQAQPPVHQPVHAELDRWQRPLRLPGRRLLAAVHDLQLRGHSGQRSERSVLRSELLPDLDRLPRHLARRSLAAQS